jgi:hypothetical protein
LKKERGINYHGIKVGDSSSFGYLKRKRNNNHINRKTDVIGKRWVRMINRQVAGTNLSKGFGIKKCHSRV